MLFRSEGIVHEKVLRNNTEGPVTVDDGAGGELEAHQRVHLVEVASRMSIRCLCVRISNYSRESMSTCGERITQDSRDTH